MTHVDDLHEVNDREPGEPEQEPALSLDVIERDDHNNANLRSFEVTWENGTVEPVPAHWVHHPPLGFHDRSDQHITFTGWYDGVHRIALSVRPDRVRCIRDLGVLLPRPDLDAEVAEEPGDVETAEPSGEYPS